MASRCETKRIFSTAIAIALLTAAQGCSGGGDAEPSGTCNPTPQTVANPAAAEEFCIAVYGALCDRAFGDCAAQIGLTGTFSSAAECKAAMTGAACAVSSTAWIDAPCASACVAVIRGGSCAVFTGSEPQACLVATGDFPPPCTATISAGTLPDTIDAQDPRYDGGYAHTYCISFTAGQAVTIRTAAPSLGAAIDDTVLHLLGPTGAQLASDDDGGTGLYSLITATIPATGEYRIVVRGFSPSYVGSYDLTVTTVP
jgi:hypothetical protein